MKTKICPKCKSQNIQRNIKFSAIWGFPQKWKCLDCEFESHIICEKNDKQN